MAGPSSQAFELQNQCRWCDETLDASDIIKHQEKYHPRPWKCPSMRCKYHDYGFADEESLQGHVSEKSHGLVSEGCPLSWTQMSASTTPSDATSLASPFDKIHLSSSASVEQPPRPTRIDRARPPPLARSWTPEAYDVQGQPVPTPSFSPLTPFINGTVTQTVNLNTFAGSEEFEWEGGSSSSPMEIPNYPLIEFENAEVSPIFSAFQASTAFRSPTAGRFTFSIESEFTVTEAPWRSLSGLSSILSPPLPETESGTPVFEVQEENFDVQEEEFEVQEEEFEVQEEEFEVQEEPMRDLPTLTDSPLSSLTSTLSPPPQNTTSASSSSLSSLSSPSFTLSPTHPSLLPKSPPTSLIDALLPFLLRPSPEHIPTPSAYALPAPKALPMGCKACLHAPIPIPTPTKPKKVSDLPFRNLCSNQEKDNREGEVSPRTCIHLSCPVCHHPLPGALALESSHPQPCIYEIPRKDVGARWVSDAELTDAPGDPDIPPLYAAVLAQHCGSDFFGSAHETQPPIPETVWESLFVCLAEERLVLDGSSSRLAKFRELIGLAGLKERREEVRQWRSRYCSFAKGWGDGIEGDTTGKLVYHDVVEEDGEGQTQRLVIRGGKRKRGKDDRTKVGQVKRRGTRRRVS